MSAGYKKREELQRELKQLRKENVQLKSELAATSEFDDIPDTSDLRGVEPFLEKGPLAVILWDENMRVQLWTGQAEAVFGWKSEEVVGKDFGEWQFVYDDDADLVNQVVGDLLVEGTAQRIRITNRNYRKDGSVIWCQWHGSVVLSEEDNVRWILTFAEDVTNHRVTQDELQAKERLYRAIVETMNDGLVVFDRNRRIVHVNPSFEKISGISSESVVGKIGTEDIAFGQDRQIADYHYGLVRNGQSVSYEIDIRNLAGDKTPILLSASPMLDDEGVFQGHVVAITDLTQVKRSEEELRRSEELLRAVFDAAEDIIFVKDASLRYTHVNRSMARALGRESSEILGMRSEDLIDREAAEHVRNRDIRVLLGESIEEEISRRIGGELRTYHEITVPLFNQEYVVESLCGISRDVTHLKGHRRVSGLEEDQYPSQSMRETLLRAEYAAGTESTVLLQGESGTGKDFLARWIHDRSKRARSTFFSVNCAALPKDLAESELFGHEAGAFSGAAGRKKGLLELAEGGTLLLNEIGELDLVLQSKLLTFFDTKSFMRVGGEQPVRIDCRILAASHRNLEQAVEDGTFLGPLYYRVNVFALRVPPLRDRLEDIPVLVESLSRQLASDLQLEHVPSFDEQFLESLSHYHWPGNIRELRNVLERSLIAKHVRTWDSHPPVPFPGLQKADTISVDPDGKLRNVLDQVSCLMIQRAIEKAGGDKSEAARLLGTSRATFYRKMAQLGMKAGNKEPA
jgi:PAS domain S-box-containing protein